MKAQTVLEGFGVGVLTTMPYIWPQFSPYHSGIYHSQIAMNSVAWGALIDVGVVSALAILIFSYLEKRGMLYRSLIWTFVLAGVVSRLVQIVLQLAGKSAPGYLSSKWVICAALAVGLLLYWLRPPAYESVVKGFAVFLSLAGFCVIWIVPQLIYQGLLPRRAETPILAKSLPISGPPGSEKRIVWILFDELSYAQTFERRFPGLAMPVFDQLKSESVLFRDVAPAGFQTDRVIPGLFLGDTIRDIKSDFRGNLRVEFVAQKGWHKFDSNATIFADAHRLGWGTGLVGWFNPYCRILPGVLDSCYWDAENDMLNGMSPENTITENALAPFKNKVSWMMEKPGAPEREHETKLREIMPQAQELIQNENIRFLFIHLPVPHPPGIFDRTTGQMRDGGTYIDNLALADRLLGELITTLKATPAWSKTTLVVSSDHSWRLPLWRNARGWTKEEEAASQGRFDTRPMLMIRFPDQTSEIDISQPFQGIEIHAILEQMLQDKLQSPAELQNWLLNPSSASPNKPPLAKPLSGN